MVAEALGEGRTNAVPIAEELEEPYVVPDLHVDDIAPPAYGEHLDQLQLSQAGFEAGAAVTDDGRVTININQKNSRLSELLAPTIRRQLLAESRPPDGPLPPAYIPPSLGGQPGQTPPPRLNVVIQIVGSRGDVQPFVALGQVLRDTYGHRVRVATHPTFKSFVEDNGLEFFSIGGDPAELMAFMVKNPGLMPGIDALKSGEITKRRQGIEQILSGCWRSCIEAGNGLGPPPRLQPLTAPVDERYVLPGDPQDRPFVADAIIANPPSFAHIHIAEKMGIPLHMMFTMPWSPTRAFPHPLANIESTNTDVVLANYVSYAMVEMMTWQGLGDVINRFRTKALGLEPLSLIWAPGLLNRLKIPTTYCWSPALIPKPADWGTEISIAGFFFLNLASNYTPEPELADFLAAGPPPVYIGFGSIVVDNPNALTRMIFDAVAATGVRALVSKGWGGLGVDSVGIPENVFMLGNCPHDWLFKHVSAVVHHGGAGTSAAGITLGKPTVVVPFFGDQPFWGAMIANAGAGPAPIPYKKLTAENLAGAIREALKPETQARAEELGARIRKEKGADMGGKSFHQFLDTDGIRCTLAPSRVAVWRVRRSKTRLSALAATLLVNEGLLKYSDLKLHRPREYNTEEQPWDPVSAVTAALVGDLGSLAMAAADFPREFFKQTGSKSDGNKRDTPATSAPTDAQTDESASAGTGGTSMPPNDTSDAASLAPSHHTTASTGPGSSAQSLQTAAAPERGLSPQPPGRGSRSPSRGGETPGEAPAFNLEAAIEAGKGVGRIAETGVKMPLNIYMSLARGFRNAPRLYNDDTIRPVEKVTGFTSGLKVAGKEFGLGLYDGVSGLVTQPLKGAEKEGARGLVKGMGKGIGGLIFKPAAAIWSVPAYTMQGLNAEVRARSGKSSLNYIITSRVLQGKEDLATANVEEQKDILVRWQTRGDELKGFYNLKSKEKSSDNLPEGVSSPPRPGWRHGRVLSTDGLRGQDRPATSQSYSNANEGEEFERAIQASVKQTSKGDKDEDARVEAAIRASVLEMRRIAEEQSREDRGKGPEQAPYQGPLPPAAVATALGISQADHDLTNITDEEYEALIEEAVKQSLTEQQILANQGGRRGMDSDTDGDEELKRAMQLSKSDVTLGAASGGGGGGGDDDEDLKRTLEESEKAHRQTVERQMTEEDIVLEYVKKQSLAEEEFRKSKGKGKGKDHGGVEEGVTGDDEDDEDLRRALEESLKISGRGGQGSWQNSAGPS